MTAVSQERALVLHNRRATWPDEVMNPFVRNLLCRLNIAVNLETTEGLYDGISRITSIA
jgi:hypothetical protein